MPSHYQADLFRELNRHRPLMVVFAHPLTADRRSLGWHDDNSGFASVTLPQSGRIITVMRLAWRMRRSDHVVNGVWSVPEFILAAVFLLSLGSKVIFYAEASDPHIPRSSVRLLARWFINHLLKQRARGLLAVSSIAERFYAASGWPKDKLMAFGYFKRHPIPASSPHRNTKEVIFVGQLVQRKQVRLLLEAFCNLGPRFSFAKLTFVGTGPEESGLREMTRIKCISERVRFEGSIPPSRIDSRIAQAAVLVLPSRFDGWGLVINEALVTGTSVIVSDACGAADLVTSADGIVVPAGDVVALSNALARCLDPLSKPVPDTVAWRENIDVLAIAPRFLSMIDYLCGRQKQRPLLPWCRTEA